MTPTPPSLQKYLDARWSAAKRDLRFDNAMRLIMNAVTCKLVPEGESVFHPGSRVLCGKLVMPTPNGTGATSKDSGAIQLAKMFESVAKGPPARKEDES